MDDFKLLLAIIGAAWVAFKTSLDSVTYLNGLRDQVLLGMIDGNEIDATHRRLIYSDWLGTAVVYLIMNIIFALIIVLAPKAMKTTNKMLDLTCWILGGWVFLATAIPFCLAMVKERPLIAHAVEHAEIARPR